LDYLSCFCAGNIEGLSRLLSDDFIFKGPLIEFSSKETYIESLKEDPPVDCQVEILKTFESGNEVCVLYTFNKLNISTPMAQYFRINDCKITETLLVFDTGVFQN